MAVPAVALSKNQRKVSGGPGLDHQYKHVGSTNWKPLATQAQIALLVADLQVPQPSNTPGTHSQPSSRPQPSHHGARLPKQQGHEVAVLAQEMESRMHGFTPLALKGDEDRSAGELQQAAQSLPEKTGLSGETG